MVSLVHGFLKHFFRLALQLHFPLRNNQCISGPNIEHTRIYDESSEDEDDDDYTPSEIGNNEQDDESGDDSSIYQELFFLSKDLYENGSNIFSDDEDGNSTPKKFIPVSGFLTMISEAQECGVLTRSQQKKRMKSTNNTKGIWSKCVRFLNYDTAEDEESDDAIHDTKNKFVRNQQHPRLIYEDDDEHFSKRMCVVCKCENREIVLRPCGCLSLCDGCREALAKRRFSKQNY